MICIVEEVGMMMHKVTLILNMKAHAQIINNNILINIIKTNATLFDSQIVNVITRDE